ncbi:hypothetical protein FACS1894208_12000 [Clostridia bacterium]|nr:hypothetical protein FACS1894208_12000 [Clostridia bacterium]
MTDQEFNALLDAAPRNLRIFDYLMVTRNKLQQHRRIAVSYSGGSDSDIILDLIELVKPENCGEIKYVFFDTGLEWDATLRHVENTERKYGIKIDRRKAKVSIPAACAKYGIPFISKDVSDKVSRLQRHGFDWNETPDGATVEKYGKCKSSMDWYFDKLGISKAGRSRFNISTYKLLREFIQSTAPDFTISEKCCLYAKKNVAHEFNAEYNPDLCINGMRQAEGGRRVGRIKNCFTPAGENDFAEYRPLWFWTDEDKQLYKEWRNVVYSDCYEAWGFKRTGCVGCPCSSNSVSQLELAQQYEPNKVKVAYAVFGKSYEYRERYNAFKANGKAGEHNG